MDCLKYNVNQRSLVLSSFQACNRKNYISKYEMKKGTLNKQLFRPSKQDISRGTRLKVTNKGTS